MSDDGAVVRGIMDLVPPPDGGVHSRTLHQEEGLRVVAFGFAPASGSPSTPPRAPPSCRCWRGD